MTASNEHEHLPTGTHVLNTNDGEPGVIMNGFAFDRAAGWTEYEVETQHGIERWQRVDMALMLEFEDDESADALFPNE
jgi:hypothetical protein